MDLRLQPLLASALFALLALPCAVTAQTATADTAHERAWTAPLTPDGQPNLQGDWTNDTYTPLERPTALGDKALFSEEEAAAFVKSRTDRLKRRIAHCGYPDMTLI